MTSSTERISARVSCRVLLKQRSATRIALVVAVISSLSVATAIHALDPPDPPPPNLPPTIVDFSVTELPVTWRFDGQVLDENPIGMVITFGGLLSGHQTTVTEPDGSFSYSAVIQGTGEVTADTMDEHGEESNTATCDVY